jgi:hypothetical protein
VLGPVASKFKDFNIAILSFLFSDFPTTSPAPVHYCDIIAPLISFPQLAIQNKLVSLNVPYAHI